MVYTILLGLHLMEHKKTMEAMKAMKAMKTKKMKAMQAMKAMKTKKMKAMKAMEVMKVMKTKKYQAAGEDQATKHIIAEQSKALTTFKMKAMK